MRINKNSAVAVIFAIGVMALSAACCKRPIPTPPNPEPKTDTVYVHRTDTVYVYKTDTVYVHNPIFSTGGEVITNINCKSDGDGGQISVTGVSVGGVTPVLPGKIDFVIGDDSVPDGKGGSVKRGCAIQVVCKDENVPDSTIEYIRSEITPTFYRSKAYDRYVINEDFMLVIEVTPLGRSSVLLSARIVNGSARIMASSMVQTAYDWDKIESACHQLINDLK